MDATRNLPTFLFSIVVLVLLNSCATLHQNFTADDLLVYTAEDDQTLIRRHLPAYIIENPKEQHNRIGTPSVRNRGESDDDIFIAQENPTIYAETRTFRGAREAYTNIIYRIHFAKIPFSLVPFYLGFGKNVGLMVVVTLNSEDMPILFTTVHTCGCYLAFTPTSYMVPEAYPDNWNTKHQNVYGEVLPGFLDFSGTSVAQAAAAIVIRNNTHRVKDIYLTSEDILADYDTAIAAIQPLSSLQHISSGTMRTTSFYEDSGHRNGYVIGSHKPWERLLMSWWALDWNVGQDKRFGRDRKDGPTFYTSLKPWARNESDMRDFLLFLKYWGWEL